MGKLHSPEELKVTRNTKQSIGKPDSHDYISMLGENQLVMGKPNSTEELEVTRNRKQSTGTPDSYKD